MTELRFRGGASAEDVAAITAVLTSRSAAAPPEDAYRLWRRTRLAALRVSAVDEAPGRSPR